MRDARLQTAVSSGEEYSMISMQRLEDLMVPRFFWLDLPAKITFHCSQDYYATSHTASNQPPHSQSTICKILYQAQI